MRWAGPHWSPSQGTGSPVISPPPRVLHDGQQGPRATIYAVSAWVAKGPWGLEAPMDLTARQQEDTVVLGSQPAS